ncbi:tRNA pseudouridine(55) synthase TruB [Geobacter sp. SVR]|uniref:tRNA pseudouridine(55) synthase TruB n=1 Tax=Geobacter sp. SVR TaxID=2495594 RepID=UPI00143EFE49|nr:tRNA pseudouridine(55) synthase TruB [Geobacter sp. SVR]BCS53446.1 tRNA pseudouridine synthase B [Geobacter sp. SVR]GCF85427.1 tRNA pseudouridine synthase B [Geobacter sp. SVR]
MLDGFFVIDKPAGITSHDVVSRVRRILGTRKVGHTGTLDPFATGVLPVAVNDGTKAIPFLDEGLKQYEAVMRLGVSTDTLDMTGRITAEADASGVARQQLDEVLARFTGSIDQVPPMYSAIKRDGQPLYKLARQGVEVERQSRRVEIHRLELTALELPFVSLRVTCSRGTYVRSLADDIGTALGCGAALETLRRTLSGPFALAAACSLDALEQAAASSSLDTLRMSPTAALCHLAEIPLSEAGLTRVRHGRSPELQETQLEAWPACEEPVLVRLCRQGALVAVAQLEPFADRSPRIVLKRVFAC